MKNTCTLFITIIVLFACACNSKKVDKNEVSNEQSVVSKDSSTDNASWVFERVVGRTVYFKYGKKFETTLYDLKYIGQLGARGKAPYLILSGRGCTECDANISIYIHSPSDGPMEEEAMQARSAYPGKERDYETDSLLFESRVFYGNCTNTQSIVWLQKTYLENGTFESSIFSMSVVDNKLKETLKSRLVKLCRLQKL
ncbi:MAG: hypothetical protein V4619_17250 [Bacteroidota bacterium]